MSHVNGSNHKYMIRDDVKLAQLVGVRDVDSIPAKTQKTREIKSTWI